jgi:hypothetical protein
VKSNRIMGFMVLVCLFALSCGGNVTLRKTDYQKVEKVHAVWKKTADIEFKTIGSVIGASLVGLGGLLTVPAGYAIERASTGRVKDERIVPDLGELILKKLVESASAEMPAWPPTVFEQKPVGKKYENKDESVIVVEVSQFWVTLYGGLTITTRATLYDRAGGRIWSKDFWYRSRDFGVKKTLEEYSADQAKLLIAEMPFAAEKIALELAKDLKKVRNDTAGGDRSSGAGNDADE